MFRLNGIYRQMDVHIHVDSVSGTEAFTNFSSFCNYPNELKKGRENMQLIKQNSFTTCGQACIAMVAGKTIETVIQDMGTDGPTSIGQLIEILDKYGIPHAERNTRISGKNPNPHPFSILTVHTNAGYTHWTLLYDGRYYDPEFGVIEGEYTFGRITSFLGIYERD